MKITIINIANKMPAWISLACDEYLKRINYGKYVCNVIPIKANKNPSRGAMEVMTAEAKKITAQIPPNSFIVALDENGIALNSIKFAQKLEQISNEYSHITFLIGGADGLHPLLKESSNINLQLSSLTFPHGLVRVVILEQIYRAITILEDHPYHRE